jgi:predicted membrane protein
MKVDTNVIPELDRSGLRKFGLVTAIIIVGLFGIILPFLLSQPLPRWPFVVFLILFVWSVAAPNSLKGIYVVWMRFGLIMGRIMTPLLLSLTFLVVVLPTALLKRILGRDSMSRQFDSHASSYRVNSLPTNKKDMEKPY